MRGFRSERLGLTPGCLQSASSSASVLARKAVTWEKRVRRSPRVKAKSRGLGSSLVPPATASRYSASRETDSSAAALSLPLVTKTYESVDVLVERLPASVRRLPRLWSFPPRRSRSLEAPLTAPSSPCFFTPSRGGAFSRIKVAFVPPYPQLLIDALSGNPVGQLVAAVGTCCR